MRFSTSALKSGNRKQKGIGLEEPVGNQKEPRRFSASGERIYSALTTALCCAIVVSNVLAAKALVAGPFALPASILTFPIVYIVNDVLSDVFGFKRARVSIMMGFAAAAFAAAAFHGAIALPGLDPALSDAFALALGSSWRILLGSFAAYLLGSLLNSYIMSSLKRRFDRYLFFRCIASTVAGESVDSIVFIAIAFAGVFEPGVILTMIASQVLFKTLYEAILYPVTKRVILAVRKRA